MKSWELSCCHIYHGCSRYLRSFWVKLTYLLKITSIPSHPLVCHSISLELLCRMYHIHLAVYMAKGLWSTSRERTIKNCLFGVLYRGSFEFSEVIRAGTNTGYTRWLEMRREQGKLPFHNRTALPDEVKVEEKLCTVQQALAVVNNACICPHGRVKFCHNCVKREQPVKTETVTNDTVQKDENNNMVHVSDHSDSGSETEPAEDDTIDALWRNAQSSMILAQAAVGGTVPTSNDISGTVSTSNDFDNLDGDVEVEQPHELLLQCPVCHKTETTQKACLKHISSSHPTYRFQCAKCDGTFPSFSTKYRHEKEHHENPKHYCAECGEGFVYNSELQCHAGKHNQVLPFPCDQCQKRFAQEKSLQRHKNVHSEQSLQCKGCDRVFTTPETVLTFQGSPRQGIWCPLWQELSVACGQSTSSRRVWHLHRTEDIERTGKKEMVLWDRELNRSEGWRQLRRWHHSRYETQDIYENRKHSRTQERCGVTRLRTVPVCF